MTIITQTNIVVQKSVIHHTGSAGDRIKILYTPAGSNELTVFEYIIDPGKITTFKFELQEQTQS